MNYSIELTPFFVNTIPKSGSHLLRQLLQGLPHVTHDWDRHWYFEGYPCQLQEHRNRLQTLQNNECAFGHVFYSDEWASMLNQLGMKRIFLYRDPRDVVVSYVLCDA
jgi:sulfotransferase 6B1